MVSIMNDRLGKKNRSWVSQCWQMALLLALAVGLLARAPAALAEEAGDAAQIRTAIKSQFDKPDAPVEVAPVAISGAHAVAGWVQADRGGRALMRREGAAWRIVLCGGDPLVSAERLSETGVPAADARAIADALAEGEARLPAAHREMFSRFEGIVEVSPASPHSHHHP